MSSACMHSFLLQLAGEEGTAKAHTLYDLLAGHGISQVRDLICLDLDELDASAGGIDPIHWDKEARSDCI